MDFIPPRHRGAIQKFWIRATIGFKGHKAGVYPLTIEVGRGAPLMNEPFMSHTYETCRSIRAISVAGGSSDEGLVWKYGGDFQRKIETKHNGYMLEFTSLEDEKNAIIEKHPFFTGLECPTDQPIY